MLCLPEETIHWKKVLWNSSLTRWCCLSAINIVGRIAKCQFKNRHVKNQNKTKETDGFESVRISNRLLFLKKKTYERTLYHYFYWGHNYTEDMQELSTLVEEIYVCTVNQAGHHRLSLIIQQFTDEHVLIMKGSQEVDFDFYRSVGELVLSKYLWS